MWVRAGAQKGISALRTVLARLISDRRGVAAIEFAFMAPLLLTMYFATMEVTQGIEADKKVGRVGSLVADLITRQQTTITSSEVKAIMEIGESVLQPYNRSRPKIIVSAIQITKDATPQVQVLWSAKLQDGVFSKNPYAKMSVTTVPESLKTPGAFLIRVESTLAYQPVITWSASQTATPGFSGVGAIFGKDGILQMGATFHTRPRMSESITCSDC